MQNKKHVVSICFILGCIMILSFVWYHTEEISQWPCVPVLEVTVLIRTTHRDNSRMSPFTHVHKVVTACNFVSELVHIISLSQSNILQRKDNILNAIRLLTMAIPSAPFWSRLCPYGVYRRSAMFSIRSGIRLLRLKKNEFTGVIWSSFPWINGMCACLSCYLCPTNQNSVAMGMLETILSCSTMQFFMAVTESVLRKGLTYRKGGPDDHRHILGV